MLENTWFFIWGLLWAVYFMLDGYDLGLAGLMPFLGKSEDDRRTLYRAMGPFWDGNEVWIITAGGVTFAAFPGTYAVMFSALYTPLMLILFALILRGAALAFRGEVEHPAAKLGCDIMFVGGSIAAAILFGVAFANLFAGVPVDAQGHLQGNLLTLLNPYGLLGGVFFLVCFLTHGAIWLAVKSTGDLRLKAEKLARGFWVALLVMAVIFLVASAFASPLYQNYLKMPVLFIVPLAAVATLLMTFVQMQRGKWALSWAFSAATIVLVTFFGVIGMYPALLPSSLSPEFSKTLTNSSSSSLTLKIMLGVVLVIIPVVIFYQAWTYKIFQDKANGPDALGEDVY